MTAEETHMYDNADPSVEESSIEVALMNDTKKPKRLSIPIFTIGISFIQIIFLVRIISGIFIRYRLEH